MISTENSGNVELFQHHGKSHNSVTITTFCLHFHSQYLKWSFTQTAWMWKSLTLKYVAYDNNGQIFQKLSTSKLSQILAFLFIIVLNKSYFPFDYTSGYDKYFIASMISSNFHLFLENYLWWLFSRNKLWDINYIRCICRIIKILCIGKFQEKLYGLDQNVLLVKEL